MKEFYPNNLGLTVMSADGPKQFAGIAYMDDAPIWRLEFTNRKALECSFGHKVFTPTGSVSVGELNVGDFVLTKNGRKTRLKSICNTGKVEPVYDLIEVEGEHSYLTNCILSKNCEFVTDDETLINPLTLANLQGRSPSFYVETSRWYMEPEPNQIYLVGLDPSMGTKEDAAAIQIFTVPGMKQVAEWQSNATNPRGQMRMLMFMLHFLYNELANHPDQYGEPEIYWTLENNSLGEANLVLLEEIGEHKFPGTMVSERKRRGQTKRFRKGLNTGKHSKIAACAQLKNLFEGGRMEVCSENLVIELKNYVRKEPSFAAKKGMTDDLVAAMLLTVRMLQNVIQQGIDVGSDLHSSFTDEEIFGDPMPVVL